MHIEIVKSFALEGSDIEILRAKKQGYHLIKLSAKAKLSLIN